MGRLWSEMVSLIHWLRSLKGVQFFLWLTSQKSVHQYRYFLSSVCTPILLLLTNSEATTQDNGVRTNPRKLSNGDPVLRWGACFLAWSAPHDTLPCHTMPYKFPCKTYGGHRYQSYYGAIPARVWWGDFAQWCLVLGVVLRMVCNSKWRWFA